VSRVHLPPGWPKFWWLTDGIQYRNQRKLQKKASSILFGNDSRPCRFFYFKKCGDE